MSRILFAVLSEKGHIHPFVAPAQELARRGHEVAFHAPFDVRPALARAGLRQVLAGSREPPPPPDENRGQEFASLVADAPRLRAWIRSMLVDSVPAQVELLAEIAAAFRPDVIAADPMGYAAPIVAAQRGIPWAALSTSLNPVVPDDWTSELIETTRALPRDELFRRFGASGSFRVSDCLSTHLTVAYTTRELVGEPPPGVLLAGASLPSEPRGDEAEAVVVGGDRPLVLMSLGTQIYHQPRMVETVVRAAEPLDVELVVAMGDVAGARASAGPGQRVQLVGYAPQLELLRKARLLITHGGANSVMEALAHDVPLLVSPICNDQHHNARFIERAGAGRTCDLQTASVEQVRRSIAALCASGPEREAAARVGRSYRAAGGASAVADAVARLAS